MQAKLWYIQIWYSLFAFFCETLTFFPSRQWDDQMLSDACRWVLDEIYIPPAAEGGMVEYRRTLIISLLFKFYLKVRRGLNQMVNGFSGFQGALTFSAQICTWRTSPPAFDNTWRLPGLGPSVWCSQSPTSPPGPLCYSPSLSLPHPWAEKGTTLLYHLPYLCDKQ